MPINPVPERGQMVNEERRPACRADVAGILPRRVLRALRLEAQLHGDEANLDFGNIAAGGEATSPLTVKGARQGDAVLVSPKTAGRGSSTSIGVVTAVDTVTVYALQHHGAGINPPPKTSGDGAAAMSELVEFVEEVAGHYFRSILLPRAGMRVPQHTHDHDHATGTRLSCIHDVASATSIKKKGL
jgi:hypothetical protein